MAHEKLILAQTNVENLISNLRGEVGEAITTWLLMRHFIGAGQRLKTGDLDKDFSDKNLGFINLLADKLRDELVGRLSELAEKKLKRLTFYFAARKLGQFIEEVDDFSDYVIKTKIRDKRNRDVSHKELPGQRTNREYLYIDYRVLLRATALALRLMKHIDRHVLGPAAPFLWKEARKRRYDFMSPPRVGYMLVPYLNLSPNERAQIVQQELAEGQQVLSKVETSINGQPATVLACKKWGVLILGDKVLPSKGIR
jgi:hypothetical protein